MTPPGRSEHLFTHTAVDLLDSYTPPRIADAGATLFNYDADRKLTSIVRSDGSIVTLMYDRGRVQAVAAGADIFSYGYDGAGRLASIGTESGQNLSFSWDGFLLTGAESTGPVTGSLRWTYDNDFAVVSEAVAGSSVSFSYDADGLLVRAGALTLTRAAQTGILAGTAIGNVTDAWTYNEFGEPVTYTASVAGAQVMSLSYERDAAGRITAIGPQSFEYDGAGRLWRVRHSGAVVSEYQYDANGNRIAYVSTSGAVSATYDDQDRMLTYGGATFAYTPNGELKSKTSGGMTTSYSYDAFGNLRQVVLPGGRTIEYVIDGQGRRVGKKVDGTLVQGWLYGDQLRIVAELDGANRVVSRFVYGARTNVPDYMVRNGVTYRILADHLGSPRLVVNTSDGTVAQSMTFDEFGNVLADSNPGFQPFGLAGGLYDRDTGLVTMGAREYDPAVGRFITKDPIGFAGGDTNLYAYVVSDPINLIDPMGTDWVDTTASFSAGFGDVLLAGFSSRTRRWMARGTSKRCGEQTTRSPIQLGIAGCVVGGKPRIRFPGHFRGASREFQIM